MIKLHLVTSSCSVEFLHLSLILKTVFFFTLSYSAGCSDDLFVSWRLPPQPGRSSSSGSPSSIPGSSAEPSRWERPRVRRPPVVPDPPGWFAAPLEPGRAGR